MLQGPCARLLGGCGWLWESVLYRTLSYFICTLSPRTSDFICTLSVRDLYFICTLSVHDLYFICTLSVRDLYFICTISPRTSDFIAAYIGLNPYYIAAYIARTSRVHPDPRTYASPPSRTRTHAHGHAPMHMPPRGVNEPKRSLFLDVRSYMNTFLGVRILFRA